MFVLFCLADCMDTAFLPLPSQLAQERPTLGLLQFPCVRLRQRNAPVTAHIRGDFLHALTAWRSRRAASCTQWEGPRERVPGQVLIGGGDTSRFVIRSHPSSDGSSVLKSSHCPFGSCFCLFFSGLRAVCSGPDMIAIRDRADRRLQAMKLGNMALQDFRLGWCFGAKRWWATAVAGMSNTTGLTPTPMSKQSFNSRDQVSPSSNNSIVQAIHTFLDILLGLNRSRNKHTTVEKGSSCSKAGKLRHSTCLMNYIPIWTCRFPSRHRMSSLPQANSCGASYFQHDHAPIRPVIQVHFPTIQSSSSHPSIHHQSKSPCPKASITGTITPLFTFNLALSLIRVYSTGQSKLTHGTSSAGAMPAHV